ncbi:hypothetical protein GCM10022222_59480 [Amycolatopsis ultiminotia]|uniref:Peptidase M28 domain-containing protein n=1 Tax=Amycolatopsis ultiminotia TaxID=543629 RepID=A0ABP6XI92_9PSEU
MAAPALTGRAPAPAPPRGRGRFALTWALIAAVLAVAFGLSWWATRPPPEGDAGRRALATAQQLQDLGVRTSGTDALARGLDLVAGKLHAIPGLQVDRQHATGVYRFHDRDVAYGVDNVIARQQGESNDTLLVNVHIDSAFEGPGAADDGVAAGALVEAARQLSGEHPKQTVVYLFNGGEEVGLTGADAFTRHPWARDVRSFLNLEAVGSGGLPVMFNAGSGSGGLVDLVGGTARPFGSIVGQTLFGAGLINSDTDSRVWRGAGWPGLDYAIFENGYGYHTPIDRVDRIDPGTAQSYVDLAAGYARSAAAGSPQQTGTPPYYFDVLSRFWVTASPLGALIGLLVLAAVLGVLVWRTRDVRRILVSAATGLAGLLLAVLAGVLAGVLQWLAGGSESWFAHPWLVYLVPLPLSALGFLLPQLRRRSTVDPVVVWYGGLTLVTFLGLLAAVFGLGAAYLLWTAAALGVVATLVALPLRGRWRYLPPVAAVLVQCVLVAEFAHSLFSLAVPVLGRLPAAFPLDPVLGVIAALIGALLALALAPLIVHARRVRWFAAATVVVTVAGLVFSALTSPYSSTRPKYVGAYQVQGDGPPRIEFEGRDPRTPAELGLVGDVARATGLRTTGDTLAATAVDVPAGALTFTPGPAAIGLRLAPTGANLVRVTVTGAVTALGGRPFAGGEAVLDLAGLPGGYTTTIQRTGPVHILVEQVFRRTGPDMAKVLTALPPWTVPEGRTISQQTFDG